MDFEVIEKLESLPKHYPTEAKLNFAKDLLGMKVIYDTQPKTRQEILDYYEKNKFSIIQINNNSRVPTAAMKGWSAIHSNEVQFTCYDKKVWEKWLNGGCNLGIQTGKISNVTIIDIDMKKIPEDIIQVMGDPCLERTNKGWHLLYAYESNIPNSSIRNENYNIDLQNDGAQVVVAQSTIDGVERKLLNLNELKSIPEDFKNLILNELKSNVTTKEPKIDVQAALDTNLYNPLIKMGERSQTLTKLGGIFRKKLPIEKVEFVLSVLNRTLTEKPHLNKYEISQMVRMLDTYCKFDEKDLAEDIFDYLEKVKSANRNEIAQSIVGTNRGEDKKRVDICLEYLEREGKILKKGNNYIVMACVEWETSLDITEARINFEMPYFNDVAYFEWRDMIIIGAESGVGKTHIAINMIKQFRDQGITPHYICLEPSSRFKRIAVELGLEQDDFKYVFSAEPESLELPKNAITIIDWLLPENYAEVDKLFQHFAKQLYKTNGILIVFMQMKDKKAFYSDKMTRFFPALVAHYLYEDEGKGEWGKFEIVKIREAKSSNRIKEIPCRYDWHTKILSKSGAEEEVL